MIKAYPQSGQTSQHLFLAFLNLNYIKFKIRRISGLKNFSQSALGDISSDLILAFN